MLFSVEPAGNGWNVSLDWLLLERKKTQGEAIDAAGGYAYRRYVTTGRPTGVAVEMRDGDSVLVLQNG